MSCLEPSLHTHKWQVAMYVSLLLVLSFCSVMFLMLSPHIYIAVLTSHAHTYFAYSSKSQNRVTARYPSVMLWLMASRVSKQPSQNICQAILSKS